jgi:hypothetical protein
MQFVVVIRKTLYVTIVYSIYVERPPVGICFVFTLFGVLTSEKNIKILVQWDVMPCDAVGNYICVLESILNPSTVRV